MAMINFHNCSADFFMSIKAERDSDVSSRARLISFPQAAEQKICVSFWYQIFGNSIGMLFLQLWRCRVSLVVFPLKYTLPVYVFNQVH